MLRKQRIAVRCAVERLRVLFGAISARASV